MTKVGSINVVVSPSEKDIQEMIEKAKKILSLLLQVGELSHELSQMNIDLEITPEQQ